MDYNKLRGRKYLHDVVTIKRYNAYHFKVTAFRTLRQKGIEDDDERKHTAKGEAGNDSKLSSSISRSRARVFELAACNAWELFVTFTLDKAKYDRYNLRKFIKDLGQFIRNYNRKYGLDIKYLLIPEQHQDGAWHMHGFLMGLPIFHLHPFELSEHLPQKIRVRLAEGKQVYTWEAYARKFGFADIEIVENHEAASKYITKYITEDMQRTVTELNAHTYYCSQGLDVARMVYMGQMSRELEAPDYSNEYVSIRNFDNYEEAEAAVI